jgi:hypothetical protein
MVQVSAGQVKIKDSIDYIENWAYPLVKAKQDPDSEAIPYR